jgi:hypothetical protein
MTLPNFSTHRLGGGFIISSPTTSTTVNIINPNTYLASLSSLITLAKRDSILLLVSLTTQLQRLCITMSGIFKMPITLTKRTHESVSVACLPFSGENFHRVYF